MKRRMDTPPTGSFLAASSQGIRLDTSEGLSLLEAEIKRERPDIVVLDSVQQVFGATDENDATAVGLIYRKLFHLRDTYGVTIILIHHLRKGNASSYTARLDLVRGSTAHCTQSSTVWLASPGGADKMNLVQVKRRESEKISLRTSYHKDEDGRITLEGCGPVSSQQNAQEQASEWILELLAETGGARLKSILQQGGETGHRKATLERALKQLVDRKLVEKPERGYYQLPSRSEGNGRQS